MMPKKAKPEDPREQMERFQKALQAIKDAGGLSAEEADKEMERVMGKVVRLVPDKE